METRDVYRDIIEKQQYINTIASKENERIVAMASYYAERILSNVQELHTMMNQFDALFDTIESTEDAQY